MRRITVDEGAELDRLAILSGEASNDKSYFVWRDSRTGRVAAPHKAGLPGTVRAEMREKQVCMYLGGAGVRRPPVFAFLFFYHCFFFTFSFYFFYFCVTLIFALLLLLFCCAVLCFALLCFAWLWPAFFCSCVCSASLYLRS